MKKLPVFALFVCALFAMSSSSAHSPVEKIKLNIKHATRAGYASSGTLPNGNTYSVVGGSTPSSISFYNSGGSFLGSYSFSREGTYYYVAHPTKVPTGYVRVDIVDSPTQSTITFYTELP
ncbi:hypothetical protein SAMN05518672_101982 [Chitinophaga sp. CF118]|uniref:hypothetical protein n=1 Tax=Chitinophaga sp. CF118 TaxID=1884367 RepID=UPI0008E84728|nr:hypothetical protein [Chitinophaga sp. CF118]SFD19467.1 hypothetical protein SAMN05518672_101982 [Chitinophaga sp. CF118]